MPLKFRRAFFYFYVGLFLLLAPLVVLYTAGYRFNFHTLRLAQVGALSITSLPKGAAIFLNGDALDSHTPTLAKRTLPGTYTLRLEKEGYTPWERSIEVKSRQTTLIEGAVLFLQTQPTKLQTRDTALSAPSHDGSVVAYVVKTDPWMELWLYHLSTDRFTLLDRWSANEIQTPRLHFTHDDYVLIVDDVAQETTTRRYYTQNGTMDDTPQWFADYTFTSVDGTVVLTSKDGTVIARLPAGMYQVDDVFNQVLLVREREREHLLLIDAATSGPPILLDTTADWARFDGDQLYVSDGFELHRYDLATQRDTLITRSSNYVQTVIPYPSGDTLLLVSNTQVIAVDISDLRRMVSTTLFSAESVQSFWIDSRGKFGYALATIGNESGLYQIALEK